MKRVDEATQAILAAFSPLGEERVLLHEALGRFSSRAIHARTAFPEFDNSAMDGFAVRAADVTDACADTPVRLPVQGLSRAGGPVPEPLRPGHAMRIFTGAMLPQGADAVVMQEDANLHEGQVDLTQAVRPGENVRARGSDFAEGSALLGPHAELGAGELALLASQDMASVHVFRRPRVAILCTGDELREIGEPTRPGSVVNSNAYALWAQVREAGAEPLVLPSVGDEREAAARAIQQGLNADVLVLSGGVSVGDYDVVREALHAAGVTLEFYKIRMKPGKPVSFGRAGRVPVLGLPGNPVSAWVTFELFVRPGLRKMLGDPTPERPRVPVVLREPVLRKPGRTEYARARLVGREGDVWVAERLGHQGSGALTSMVGVDVLVVLPDTAERIPEGTRLEAVLLRPR